MRHPLASLILIPTVAAAIAACGNLAPNNYNGEPLLQLRGTVTNPQALTPAGDDTRAYLIWSGATSVVASETEVAADFPADFVLDVLEPPPDEVFIEGEDTGATYATGYVFFMTPAQKDILVAGINSSSTSIDTGVIGLARSTILYMADEASAAAYGDFGEPTRAGFNQVGIVTSECVNEANETVSCESSAMVPLNTPVPVKLHENFGDGVNL
jgi:hypothetical protein